MKRKANSTPSEPAKRLRLDREPGELVDIKSLREQADPYLLGTARFQLDALTSTWSLGSNRQIHENHIQSLCRIFEEQGLQRELVENRLRITCTRIEFQRMMTHLGKARDISTPRERHGAPWLSFEDWTTVNSTKAEIMAGQHRVEALKLYLRRRSSNYPSAQNLEKEQQWWICDVYDKDQLPAQLNVKLRANRQGSILPDSHGQIWMELAILAAADCGLFQGANTQVQDEMLGALGLSGRVPFPMRRLMTLWKNRSWQPMVTRWCYTSIGRETFNVSLWEEMARHRIDDFWFDIFEKVLSSLSRLTANAPGSIKFDDWNILARDLRSRSEADVQGVFYPGAAADVLASLESRGHAHRRAKFLAAFDHTSYHRIYRCVLVNSDLGFPDIQGLLRVGRQHGKILSQIMTHVGQWLNPHPKQISDRENNKPPLWRDFLPAFADESSDKVEELARHLQRQIFDAVHERVDEFINESASTYLCKFPDSQGDSYLERFAVPIWNDILIRVHQVAGPRFQGSLSKFNAQSPKSLSYRPESSLTHLLRGAISRIPEIRLNPALCNSQALEVLMARISPIVTDWQVHHSDMALNKQSWNSQPLCPSTKRDLITLAQCQTGTVISESVQEQHSPQRCILPSITAAILPPIRLTEGRCCRDSASSDEREDFRINRPTITKLLNT